MQVAKIGVIGAGQMGGGIAQVAAQSGIDVVLVDAQREWAEKGRKKIEAALEKLVQKGKLKAEERAGVMARITIADNYAGFESCDVVVEAATENQELKKKIFQDLDKAVKPGAILASNTSSISITLLGAQTKRPEKVIGMHFMNPVPVMKLVEIVRGLATDEDTYQTVLALGGRFGKSLVTAKDIPGFIVNRLLIPFLNEACFALQESLGSIEDIDQGIKLGLNHPMGPFELADLIGLDTCLAISEVLHNELGDDKYRPAPLLRQYVAAGWLGRKSGRGFYKY
ncbi:MAG: 3-hydroxybutyryl-CoA dehydrogenase [Myxococcales bacterium]|nr:3-hydroxybutyryl-CoA dehydrogenase [Myxococcales bacterium]